MGWGRLGKSPGQRPGRGSHRVSTQASVSLAEGRARGRARRDGSTARGALLDLVPLELRVHTELRQETEREMAKGFVREEEGSGFSPGAVGSYERVE